LKQGQRVMEARTAAKQDGRTVALDPFNKARRRRRGAS
jgi:hypothetical protein